MKFHVPCSVRRMLEAVDKLIIELQLRFEPHMKQQKPILMYFHLSHHSLLLKEQQKFNTHI